MIIQPESDELVEKNQGNGTTITPDDNYVTIDAERN